MKSSDICLLSFCYIHEHMTGSGPIAYHLTKELNKTKMSTRAFVLSSEIENPNIVDLANVDLCFRYYRRSLSILRRLRLIKNHVHRALLAQAFDYLLSKQVCNSKYLIATNENVPYTFGLARRMGIYTMSYLGNPHCDFTRELVKQEMRKWSVADNDAYVADTYLKIVSGSYEETDLFICANNFIYRTFIEHQVNPGRLISVHIPSGVELGYFFPLSKPVDKIFRVFYLAHSTLLKGLQYLLEAWGRLHLKNSELVIAGGMDNNVKSVAKEHFFSLPNVRYLGRVPTTLEYFQRASVFVVPSLADGGPRTVWEAMACGLPVIITENCGASEWVTDGQEGFVVPIRDSEAIAAKIEFLYNNQEHLIKMGRQAWLKRKEFSIKNNAKRLSETILHLITND